MIIRSHRLLQIGLILCFAVCGTLATSMKWTRNKNDPYKDTDAANAPRSQKYWDENNIERPDYALTDDEYTKKYGKLPRSWTQKTLALVKWVVILGTSVKLILPWIRMQWYNVDGTVTSYGERLGGSRGLSPDEAKIARLARLSQAMKQSDANKVKKVE